jgi:hypothetical protein
VARKRGTGEEGLGDGVGPGHELSSLLSPVLASTTIIQDLSLEQKVDGYGGIIFCFCWYCITA